jgi:hypothetical protein
MAPLWQAAQGGQEGVVKSLPARDGVDASLRDQDGRTLLATEGGGGAMAKLLKLLLAHRSTSSDSHPYCMGRSMACGALTTIAFVLGVARKGGVGVDCDERGDLSGGGGPVIESRG